jgi:hypothetical protein
VPKIGILQMKVEVQEQELNCEIKYEYNLMTCASKLLWA